MEKVKLRILGISCHHRRARNTAWLTLFALKAVEKFGRRISDVAEIETEFIDLRERTRGLPNLPACKRVDGFYDFEEDDYITSELIPKMAEADGFIFGSPVFTGSFTSKFITLCERLRAGVKQGFVADKPAGCVSVATMPMGGQDRCLEAMEICTRSLGMIPVHPLFGCSGTTGVPYGPLSGDDDGTVIAVKNDRFAQWTAILVGRRVAEVAVMQKIAKRQLGNLYQQEFIRKYAMPFGGESWAWTELDEKNRQFMDNLDRKELAQMEGKLSAAAPSNGDNAVSCKILGLGCDDYLRHDTNWLIINSLKAVEKFGSRLGPVANFQWEFLDLGEKKLKACLNCDKYPDMPNGGKRWRGVDYPARDTYGCVQKDYFSKEILTRYAEADGIILGSSVIALAPSITFRLFAERMVAGIWTGFNNLKPIANIAVSYDIEGGQESCLNIMNTCNRWNESLPLGWPHGTSAAGSSPDALDLAVKSDAKARTLSVINARRLAQFALMKKLALRELGDVYKREFYFVIHPPHGDAGWEWSRLDDPEHKYMLDLDPRELARLGKGDQSEARVNH